MCGYSNEPPRPILKNEFIISLYNENDVTNIFTSRRRKNSGYHFPYKDLSDKVVYNYKIDQQLNEMFGWKIKIDEPLKGNDLLKYIVNQIVDKLIYKQKINIFLNKQN